MWEAYTSTLENLSDIKGRITRKQFWSTIFFNYLFIFILAFFSEALIVLAALAIAVVNLIIGIKRAHDVGYGGWVILIPLFNLIVFCSDSDGDNQWGPSLS
tara:strand:+ start:2037 stop:2339 length:303 start_codon:yes stop_codon:yes gene_type:complete